MSARTKVGRVFGNAVAFMVSYALLVSAPAAAHGPIATLGQNSASSADYTQAIAQLSRPRPDHDLERAHLIAAPRSGTPLFRLASALPQSSRPDVWLGRQGEIPEKAGTIVAACAAYGQAIATIDAPSERHRRTRATPDLEACPKGTLLQLRR